MDPSALTWLIFVKDLPNHIYREDRTPEFLTEGTLLLFHRFKTAYDSKNVEALGKEIAKDFQGEFYGCMRKQEVVEFFDGVFANMFLVHPQLRITVHHILKNEPSEFTAILEFDSQVSAMGIKLGEFATGRVVCKARPYGRFGEWKISSLEELQDEAEEECDVEPDE